MLSSIQNKSKKYTNIWKILFGVSLVINIVIVGAVTGLIMRFSDSQLTKKYAPGGFYVRAMNHKDRYEFLNEMKKHKNAIQPDTSWERSSYNLAIEMLKSEDFNQKAFRSLLEKQVEHVQSRRNFVRSALIAYISNLTKEERLDYAERLEDLKD